LEVSEVSEQVMRDPALGSFDAVILQPSLNQSRDKDEKTVHAWLRA